MEIFKDRLAITKDWLPRYTGMEVDEFGDYVLLTNFGEYISRFAEIFSCDIHGETRPMQAATNSAGLSIVNFGIGSPNAAIIMDLLTARAPDGVLFLGSVADLRAQVKLVILSYPSLRFAVKVRAMTTILQKYLHCLLLNYISLYHKKW